MGCKSFYETCSPEVRFAADKFIQHLRDGISYAEEELTPQEAETKRIQNKSW